MGSLIAFAMLAAVSTGGLDAVPAAPLKATASARATVRILPGAKVSLGAEAEAQGWKLNEAVITAEDGRQQAAKLLEFQ